MENPESTKKEASKSWLQYVTEQSWEPELLISGLAIYATLKLPALLLPITITSLTCNQVQEF